MTHDCGHVVYVFRTWLIVMSHGFHACDALSAHDLVCELLLVLVCCTSWLIGVNWWIFTLWLAMSHESCDAEYESHRVRGRGGLGYIRRPPGTVLLARTFSPTPPAKEISTPWEIIVGRPPLPFSDGPCCLEGWSNHPPPLPSDSLLMALSTGSLCLGVSRLLPPLLSALCFATLA